MSPRHRFVSILALALAAVGHLALEASTQSDALSAATPLRTSRTAPFAQDQWLSWKPPVICDGDGNVFLVPVPRADPRDLELAPAPPRYTKKPSDILRVSADGKKTTLIEPAAIPAFTTADSVSTVSLAFDQAGSLIAVVRVTRGDSGNQYIVSFDGDGRYRSHQEVDPDELFVHRLEALGAGQFLLFGVHLGVGPRVAIMDVGGGSLRDLPASGSENEGDETSPALEYQSQAEPPKSPTPSDHLVRGGDGRIYYVPQGTESVHVIDKTGERRIAFKLASISRSGQHRLVDLKAAGTRLVAVYYEEQPEHRARFWMAVYDVNLGERVALYGPAAAVPICYQQNMTGQEQFTLLNGATLVTMSP